MLVDIMPVIVGIALVGFMVWTIRSGGAVGPNTWMLPAVISVLFLAWSLAAVVLEGPFGFWPVHTENLWGNQVWFDLLFAVGIGWFFIVPQARTLGMPLVPWAMLVLCTGCIGFLAMVARLLYLSARTAETTG